VLVGASHRDLLKHGAQVLGVACHECPPLVVSQMLGVTNGGQALSPRCVALILDRNKATMVSMRLSRWCSQNSMRALWAALSRVSSRLSPVAVVNQDVMPRSEG
jgi:hypothetical protein